MKKQIAILLLLVVYTSAQAQGFFRKTSGPCNPSMTDTIKGKWVKGQDILSPQYIGFNKMQVQEVLNRLDAVHKLAFEAYPNLVGVDAGWHHSLGYLTFADQVKYKMDGNGTLHEEPIKENPVAFFNYEAAFFNYFCYGSKNEIWSGLNGETSTSLSVSANNLSSLLGSSGAQEDDATIDGYPIKIRKTIIGNWKGYDLYTIGRTGMELYAVRYILIHRKDEMPYIPVSRKQYLERCLSYFNKFYGKMLADADSFARKFISAGITDAQTIKEEKNKNLKTKKRCFEKISG